MCGAEQMLTVFAGSPADGFDALDAEGFDDGSVHVSFSYSLSARLVDNDSCWDELPRGRAVLFWLSGSVGRVRPNGLGSGTG